MCVVLPYAAITSCICAEPQLCSGERVPLPPVPPEKLMYATTPAGLVAALAIDARPPMDAPASTTCFASAHGCWRSQASVDCTASAAADAEIGRASCRERV